MDLKLEFNRFRKRYCFEIISAFVTALFRLEKIFYSCKCINYPKEKCIFALWQEPGLSARESSLLKGAFIG